MSRSGRTLDMVKGLPEAGSIVVVHDGHMVDHMKRLVREVRGDAVALVTRVRGVRDKWDAERVLRGTTLPIYVDHAFWDLASREAFEAVDRLVSGRDGSQVATLRRLRHQIERFQAGPIVLLEASEAPIAAIEGDLKRLDIEEGDVLVFRSPRKLDAEQSNRIADQVQAFAEGHGYHDVRILVLDQGSDLTVHRQQVQQACQGARTRRTPFGCPEDPRVTSPFEVTSASISEAAGGCRAGRAALPPVGG